MTEITIKADCGYQSEIVVILDSDHTNPDSKATVDYLQDGDVRVFHLGGKQSIYISEFTK